MKAPPTLAIQSMAAKLGEVPPAPAVPTAAQAKYIRCRAETVAPLAKFIDDLKIARSASRDTGGVYSAFLHLADGRVLQLEIGLTI